MPLPSLISQRLTITPALLLALTLASGPQKIAHADGLSSPARLDLSIQTINGYPDGEWTGADVINTTTLNQSVTVEGTKSYAVRLTNTSATAAGFTLTLPASSNGWTAKLYSEIENGQEITPDAEHHWLTPEIAGKSSHTYLLEVTAPQSLAEAATLKLLASDGTATDAVAVVHNAAAPLDPNAQPDLAVRLISAEDPDTKWIGPQTFSEEGANQTLAAFAMVDAVQNFDLGVKNAGTSASTFKLMLPPPIPGWKVSVFDDLENGTDITQAITSADGWNTPTLAINEIRHLLVKISPDGTGHGSYNAAVKATSGGKPDAVLLHNDFFKITGVEWIAPDGKWHLVTAPISVTQNQIVSVRAIFEDPKNGWMTMPEDLPKWISLGQELFGEDTTLNFEDPGSFEVTVRSGNVKSITVHVTEDDDN